MHGLIHVAFKDLVVVEFGADAWAAVLAKLGVEDDTPILDANKQYPDELTLKAIGTACEVADLPLGAALEAFGSHFVKFLAKRGLVPFLRLYGDSLGSLLKNLNELYEI